MQIVENDARSCHETSVGEPVVVASFYRFVALPDFRDLRQGLIAESVRLGLRGTILLAPEGINGTIAGPASQVPLLFEYLSRDSRLEGLVARLSGASVIPFRRLRVRLKKEIITLRTEGADPTQVVGSYVDPGDWNALLADPEVTVVDTRNGFEVAVGSFQRAIDPGTKSFGQFPSWAAQNLDPAVHRKVAMYCTGGIRCEKATALLLNRGFQQVYHLRGGILGYLEHVPAEDSLWRGECVVFDERGSVQ